MNNASEGHAYFAAIKSGSSAVILRDRATFIGLLSTTTGLTLARAKPAAA